MDTLGTILGELGAKPGEAIENGAGEIYLKAAPADFKARCLAVHKKTDSPVMTLFAADEKGRFLVYCAFLWAERRRWIFVFQEVSKDPPAFDSLAADLYSSAVFEREMREMFGIEARGARDTRRLKLHGEVWPAGYYPLRKDFVPPPARAKAEEEYIFAKVEGEGLFQVPVGPVHAGVIGPGHFRFSVAGEPIINLEARLGFTHRGVEKLFEGQKPAGAVKLSECVSGDSAFAHSLAFCLAAERALGAAAPPRARLLRAVFLELERLYNHANDIGGMAVDVGFSFPAMCASLVKEQLLALNETLTGSRYLKGVNLPGGVSADLDGDKEKAVLAALHAVEADLSDIKDILYDSVSFMDRVDTTGILAPAAAKHMGVKGPAGRASGVALDLRKVFPDGCEGLKFSAAKQETGDVLARLNIRFTECDSSVSIIRQAMSNLRPGPLAAPAAGTKAGFAMGCCEGWRGPVLYWLKLDGEGRIDRCKVTDPSTLNWAGLCHAAPGNIVPDFPLCNKSFDLSYSGNDL
ncbi:MAG: hypothetical protein A3J79_04650 [Elusimicrobia bacterium RIFOXYB2_FULL_62_6]|nr:MAG: hypothetical protein A3J79_04650 [Elusimicrobia bacterium RIFOXYB2_FULL_62_6]